MNKVAVALTGLSLILSGCGGQKDAASAQKDQSSMAGMDMGGMDMNHAQLSAQDVAACGATNVARGRPASSSSNENNNFNAAAAFDGNANTRWSSAWSDKQWLEVNLGSAQQICSVTLQWEGISAYGKAFEIQGSNDGATWAKLASVTNGAGGTQTLSVSNTGSYQRVRMSGTQRGSGYGYSLLEFQVFAKSSGAPSPTSGYVFANPPVTGVTPSTATPPHRYFHEFQANCAVSRTTLPDDPIVYPGQPGASHMHTFLGNTTTNAGTTLASLQAGGSSCSAPDDRSGYWMPTMYNGNQAILPVGPQVIYYKTGVLDYTSVRPFPSGLRFLVGDMNASPAEFLAGSYEGWECGNSYHNADFPASCPAGTQLNIRYQAPSCWDGIHLDSPDHKSHMAYPVDGRCTADHPVAVPMLEFKMAFPAGSDTSQVRLSSGRGYSFHYDFFNAWDPATLQAMVKQCINGGFQCNARGYDETHPEAGAALGTDYRLH